MRLRALVVEQLRGPPFFLQAVAPDAARGTLPAELAGRKRGCKLRGGRGSCGTTPWHPIDDPVDHL